jgi:hypothetical protein
MLRLDPADTLGLSQAVGVGRRWVRRYRAAGLTERQADGWATRCGLHPLEVWPDWPDGPVSRGADDGHDEQGLDSAHATASQVADQ